MPNFRFGNLHTKFSICEKECMHKNWNTYQSRVSLGEYVSFLIELAILVAKMVLRRRNGSAGNILKCKRVEAVCNYKKRKIWDTCQKQERRI